MQPSVGPEGSLQNLQCGVRRVKVKQKFVRKSFFEKLLSEWKDSTEDRNFRFILSKALINLKNFPLEVETHGDLKNVKGSLISFKTCLR